MPWMLQIALCDLLIPPDVKTQGWHDVSLRAFIRIRTGPTQA
jgi:hypothetical protein